MVISKSLQEKIDRKNRQLVSDDLGSPGVYNFAPHEPVPETSRDCLARPWHGWKSVMVESTFAGAGKDWLGRIGDPVAVAERRRASALPPRGVWIC
jgi:hypothetical protein